MVESSQLGLEPNGPLGEAALVPFKNKRTRRLECQLMVMYRGYIELGDRTDRIAFMDAQIVYDCDKFEFEYGTDQRLRHVPALSRPKDSRPVAGYALVKYKTGEVKFVVLSFDEIEEIRQCSRAKAGDAWTNWWGEMAKKTCLRRLVKYVSLSAELTRAAYLDESLDGGVRPEDSSSSPAAYYDSTAADALRERLSKAGEPETIDAEYAVEGDAPPPTDGDGVVTDEEAWQEAEAEAEANASGPLDTSMFDGSKFVEKYDELFREFVELAVDGQGLSEDEAGARWGAKVIKLLGAEGFTTLAELSQSGKNAIVKGLAAAVKDYRAALDARQE
jgi:recombinational DNA repair protein RecT